MLVEFKNLNLNSIPIFFLVRLVSAIEYVNDIFVLCFAVVAVLSERATFEINRSWNEGLPSRAPHVRTVRLYFVGGWEKHKFD